MNFFATKLFTVFQLVNWTKESWIWVCVLILVDLFADYGREMWMRNR